MKRLVLVLLVVVAPLAFAESIDADDCEGAAHRLKSAATELEDAAGALGSATRREARDAEQQVRSQARDAVSEADRVRRACDATAYRTVPANLVFDVIRDHLLAKFGPTDDTRKKIAKRRPQLEALAQAHSRIMPADLRMTLAVAELVFQGDE